MDAELFGRLLFYVIVLLFAVSAHEAAHAWMSYRFGDDTAYLLGRVTLNPASHTDPIGTLLIPVISFIAASAGVTIPLIGWGKPTPVNPMRWRNKDVANIMVSLAGIIVNAMLAITAFVVLKAMLATGVISAPFLIGIITERPIAGAPAYLEPVTLFLNYMLIMNASFAVFNLLPFPPLDGSKVLYSLLPSSMGPMLDVLEQYGFILLMAAVYFGLFRAIFRPIAQFIYLALLGF